LKTEIEKYIEILTFGRMFPHQGIYMKDVERGIISTETTK